MDVEEIEAAYGEHLKPIRNTVTKNKVRDAALQLIEAASMDSGVSPICARHILAMYRGNGRLQIREFLPLDKKNMEAAQTLLQYSIFERNIGLPLTRDEVNRVERFVDIFNERDTEEEAPYAP